MLIRTLCAGAFALACAVSASRAETCIASFYGTESGPLTANGERFHPEGISCAHKTRPFGSIVWITRIDNGNAIACRINDRGPFVPGRCIDLSVGAARMLGIHGTARVRLE